MILKLFMTYRIAEEKAKTTEILAERLIKGNHYGDTPWYGFGYVRSQIQNGKKRKSMS